MALVPPFAAAVPDIRRSSTFCWLNKGMEGGGRLFSTFRWKSRKEPYLRQHSPTIVIIFCAHFTQSLSVVHMDGTESCEWCSVKGHGLHRICDKCVCDKLNLKQDVGKKWLGLQTCVRCNHTWYPRKAQRPYTCPSCRSPMWDRVKGAAT